MAQCHWTYLGHGGRKYKIGLYHGTRSGHLLIHCNAKVVQVDFKVFESKSYTFFIDDELVKIHLERKGDRMHYSFEVDKQVDTPLNRARKKRDTRNLKHTLAFFGALVLAAILFASVMIWLNKGEGEDLEALVTMETTARLLDSPDPLTGKLSYEFQIDGIRVRREETKTGLGRMWGDMLQAGDEFSVMYEPNPPHASSIMLSKPTPGQSTQLIKRAANKHISLHPGDRREIVTCMASKVAELKGVPALADLFHQNEPPEQSLYHNHATYLRLVFDVREELPSNCYPVSFRDAE